jgi:hypothetical protein
MVNAYNPDRSRGGLILPEGFAFSQSNLQAYTDCPRRFWLAYIQQLPWPALEAAPAQQYEQHLRQGAVFHKLVERAETGLHVESHALPEPLADWYAAYEAHRPTDLDLGRREVEFVITATLPLPPPVTATGANVTGSTEQPAVRLAAKYDLICIIDDGPIIIIDWKTSLRRPSPETLQRKWQTSLYPFVLVEAADRLAWGPITPERIELRYWFAADPQHPISFRYDQAQHVATRRRLDSIISDICNGETDADFPKVPDTEEYRSRYCQYCIYRSRCNRGVFAGDMRKMAEEDYDDTLKGQDIEFTLDDVGELAF